MREMEAMLAMIISVRIKPDQRQVFLEAIEDDAICSERDEPGCLRFNVLQDQADENRFHLYEVYRDQQAFDAHREAPHYKRFSAVAAEALAAPVNAARTNTVFPRDGSYWG